MNKKQLLAVPVALILILVTALVVIPAMAQDGTTTNTDRSITVSGSGQASGSPDIAYVQVGIEVANEDLGIAYNEAGTKIAAVIQALTELGIAEEDLQTSGLNIWWDEEYGPNGPTGNRTYRVSNTVNVKVRDITMIDSVINTAVNNGANTIYGLTFGIEDTAALESEARSNAVDDARARAEHLAELMGVALGEPIYVVEGSTSGGPIPYANARMEMAMAADGGQSIQPGQQSVTVNITVSYAIK